MKICISLCTKNKSWSILNVRFEVFFSQKKLLREKNLFWGTKYHFLFFYCIIFVYFCFPVLSRLVECSIWPVRNSVWSVGSAFLLHQFQPLHPCFPCWSLLLPFGWGRVEEGPTTTFSNGAIGDRQTCTKISNGWNLHKTSLKQKWIFISSQCEWASKNVPDNLLEFRTSLFLSFYHSGFGSAEQLLTKKSHLARGRVLRKLLGVPGILNKRGGPGSWFSGATIVKKKALQTETFCQSTSKARTWRRGKFPCQHREKISIFSTSLKQVNLFIKFSFYCNKKHVY